MVLTLSWVVALHQGNLNHLNFSFQAQTAGKKNKKKHFLEFTHEKQPFVGDSIIHPYEKEYLVEDDLFFLIVGIQISDLG